MIKRILLTLMVVAITMLPSCQTLQNSVLIKESTIKSSPTIYVFQLSTVTTVAADKPYVGFFTDHEEMVPNLKNLGKEGISLKQSEVPGHYIVALTPEETEFYVLFTELEEYKRKVVFKD